MRQESEVNEAVHLAQFPRLRTGTFIEVRGASAVRLHAPRFLRFQVGTFIEVLYTWLRVWCRRSFPFRFLEGLSIRQINILKDDRETVCSVP